LAAALVGSTLQTLGFDSQTVPATVTLVIKGGILFHFRENSVKNRR